ncbi:hypothetical protein [Streptomyces sp. NRRL S-118]|uniref:hypothetical protein n=1 Tax=Streptomyces sp. NRRL S-118 TaxID=1463881 RepID=UPI00131B8A1A|nr:hypothetical protein [Streptomyces sp. NRRL S-118]
MLRGAGAGDIAVLAAELARTQRGAAGRWVLASARGEERAYENAFVDALAEALARPRAGAHQEYLGVRSARIRDLALDRPVDVIEFPLPVDALAAHGSDIVVGMRNDIVVLGRMATPPPPPRSPAPPPPARTAPATPPAAPAWPS